MWHDRLRSRSLFCLRVIWIELIRRPLAAASDRCHDNVSSVERGMAPQVSLLRETFVCVCVHICGSAVVCMLGFHHIMSNPSHVIKAPQPPHVRLHFTIHNSVCASPSDKLLKCALTSGPATHTLSRALATSVHASSHPIGCERTSVCCNVPYDWQVV